MFPGFPGRHGPPVGGGGMQHARDQGLLPSQSSQDCCNGRRVAHTPRGCGTAALATAPQPSSLNRGSGAHAPMELARPRAPAVKRCGPSSRDLHVREVDGEAAARGWQGTTPALLKFPSPVPAQAAGTRPFHRERGRATGADAAPRTLAAGNPPRRQPAGGRGNVCFPFPFLGGIWPARSETVCLRSPSP